VDDAHPVQVGQRGGDRRAQPGHARQGAGPAADGLARIAGAQLARRRVERLDHVDDGHDPGVGGVAQPLDLRAQPVDGGRRRGLDHHGAVFVHVEPDVHVHAMNIDEPD
jgi:hypothetical protein